MTVAIFGIAKPRAKVRRLFSLDDDSSLVVKEAGNINAYLVPGKIWKLKNINSHQTANRDDFLGIRP